MKTIFLLICGVFLSQLLHAQPLAGVYTFSKGLNKAESHAYVFSITADSVFVYLHSVSGAPEFNTEVVRGWVRMTGMQGFFLQGKDTLLFSFKTKALQIKGSGSSTLHGNYRLAATQTKQLPAMLFPQASFKAQSNDTLLLCYKAPSVQASQRAILFSKAPITVLDSFQLFYLVEHPKHRREFLWVPRSQFMMPKKITLPKK